MGTAWRKSSFSGTNGNCVEVRWRKSSFSGTNGDCVEVDFADVVGVRDSKKPQAGQLSFPPAAWVAFLQEPSREQGR
ncbi:DUF397 domain-containing protein [Actinokineospora sp. HUAS TT18]|uniref:DUF397 domain-containing protein n=1 Tax=Actinokineospora sp. HUAS TT18 TaxID=3447451 RepID=UPI003F51F972